MNFGVTTHLQTGFQMQLSCLETLGRRTLICLVALCITAQASTSMSRGELPNENYDLLWIFKGCSSKVVEINDDMKEAYYARVATLEQEDGVRFPSTVRSDALIAVSCDEEVVVFNDIPDHIVEFGGVLYIRMNKTTYEIVSEMYG